MKLWIVVLFTTFCLFGVLELAPGLASPAEPLPPGCLRASAPVPPAPPRFGPRVEPDVETACVDAAEPEIRMREAAPIERLLVGLREACASSDTPGIASILDEITTLLAEPDATTELAVATAVHEGGPAATRLRFLVYRYPDVQRRRVLRTHIAEAAPPAPAALPSLGDAPAVAAFLTGARSAADREWVLRRLSPETLATPEVSSALVDIVLRSTGSGPLASRALALLCGESSETAEKLAIRVLDESSEPALRRSAIRLLGSVAGADGTARLIEIVRSDVDRIARRHAAAGLMGLALDETAISILATAAGDPNEDRLVRLRAVDALRSAARGNDAVARMATESLVGVRSCGVAVPCGDTGDFLVYDAPPVPLHPEILHE